MFGTAEGWLGVDDPVLLEKLSQKPAEATWLGQTPERSVELKLVLPKELFESSGELSAEDPTERADRQEEAVRRSDPSGMIWSKAASRNDVMNVGMMLKVLSPGMEH